MNVIQNFEYDWNSPFLIIKHENYSRKINFIKNYEIKRYFPYFYLFVFLSLGTGNIYFKNDNIQIMLIFIMFCFFMVITHSENQPLTPTNSDYICFTTPLNKTYYIHKNKVKFEEYLEFYLWLRRSEYLRKLYIEKIQTILNKLSIQTETVYSYKQQSKSS